MTAPAEQRVRHRRRVTGRRAVVAGVSALGVTGAAVITTSKKVKTCVRFEGNSTGKEPMEPRPAGPDGETCAFAASDIKHP
ncbi:hypothetical protein [Streptomyces sp. NPDC029554]|uniref:hypothetical protein n=1 Tax=Streptomyces sp. NPDC029554 TaxID=3155126 RepID=UPI0033D786B8